MKFFSSTKVRSILAAGVVAASSFSGAVAAQAAEPNEGDLAPVGLSQSTQGVAAGSAFDAPSTTAVTRATTMAVDITPGRVILSEGKVLDVHGRHSELTPAIDAPSENVLVVRAEVPGYDRTFALDATFAYRISMLGEPTRYWVKLWPATYGMAPDKRCAIYLGDPSTDGMRADTAPFTCGSRYDWNTPRDLHYHYDIGLNRDAEASGTIAARKVSLTSGTFRTDVPYSIIGEASLSSGQSTRFDTVLREGDKPFYENQARTEFAYEIVDNGEGTGLWIAGVSTNHRGFFKFSADGHCGIYSTNPLLDEGRLDDSTPITSDKYFCKATGDFVHGPGEDGNGHFHADFTVGKR